MRVRVRRTLRFTIITIFICLLFISISNTEIGDKNSEKINEYGENKFETSTEMEWLRLWGNSGNGVAVDQYNNCYLVGEIDNDAFIVKYNLTGNMIWNQTWGGVGDDSGYALAVDTDQNTLYLTGTTESFNVSATDGFLAKFDLNGTLLWNKTWGGVNTDGGLDLAVESLGYCYIAGLIDKYNSYSGEGILLKFDTNGSQLWNRTYGGLELEDGTGVAIDSGNNVYLAGTTASFAVENYDLYLTKFTSTGIQVWNKTYDYDSGDRCFGLAVDGLNNCYLVGDPGLLKYDSEGNLVWRQTLDFLGRPLVTDVAVDTSNYCYVTGHTRIDDIFKTRYPAFIVKCDPSGDAVGHRLIYNDDLYDFYWGNRIAVDAFNNIYVAGDIIWDSGFLFISNKLYPIQITGFEWVFLFILGEVIGLMLIEMKYK